MKNILGVLFAKQHCHVTLAYKQGSQITCNEQFLVAADNKQLALRKIKSKLKNLRYHTVLGLPQRVCQIQSIQVDAALTDSEIVAYLHAKTANQYCDYVSIEKHKNTQTIRVVSAAKETIAFYQNLFASEKVPLHIIDVNLFAIRRIEKYTKIKIHGKKLTVSALKTLKKTLQTQQPQINSIYGMTTFGLCLWE